MNYPDLIIDEIKKDILDASNQNGTQKEAEKLIQSIQEVFDEFISEALEDQKELVNQLIDKLYGKDLLSEGKNPDLIKSIIIYGHQKNVEEFISELRGMHIAQLKEVLKQENNKIAINDLIEGTKKELQKVSENSIKIIETQFLIYKFIDEHYSTESKLGDDKLESIFIKAEELIKELNSPEIGHTELAEKVITKLKESF